MKLTCPCCATSFPIESGLVEGDAKRLAKLCADLEPAVARASLSYLRLFKPVKQELRVSRAVLILTELAELIASQRISKDDRTGLYRPCSTQLWVQGMEQMQQHGVRLELPLKSHGYLRAIVFGLADVADAKAEQQRDKDRQQSRHVGSGLQPLADPFASREDKLTNALSFAKQMRQLGRLSDAQYQAECLRVQQLYANPATAISQQPTEP